MRTALKRILTCAASNCKCRLNFSPVGTRSLLDEIDANDREVKAHFPEKNTSRLDDFLLFQDSEGGIIYTTATSDPNARGSDTKTFDGGEDEFLEKMEKDERASSAPAKGG